MKKTDWRQKNKHGRNNILFKSVQKHTVIKEKIFSIAFRSRLISYCSMTKIFIWKIQVQNQAGARISFAGNRGPRYSLKRNLCGIKTK